MARAGDAEARSAFDQRKAIEPLAHVGAPSRKPHPNGRRDRDHRRDSALATRASAAVSTSAPTRIRSPAASTISMRPTSTRADASTGAAGALSSETLTGKSSNGSTPPRGASRVPTPPGEQQIGIDAVALGHLRHGRAWREARQSSAACPHSTRTDADALHSDPAGPTSSIVPIIVDGHYPRATLRALPPHSAPGPGGLRRRLTSERHGLI
jgi:hypothetical protein